MKIEWGIILLLLIVSFPAVKALLQPGGFTSHDLTHHVIRQISMDKLLSEGQFPPRWSGELNNGFGYPVFLFNYPLPALVGEVFHKMGLPAGRQGLGFVDSVKAVLLTSMLVSVFGMYLFLNSLLKDKMAAFLGVLFYLYAPIRFLNVYVSSAVGSALALAIIPFVFWSISLISKGDRRNWGIVIGGLSLALLILAHNVTALIFLPVIIVFSFVCSRLRSNNNLKDYYRNLGLMLILGLGLSAWFWLPAAFEARYIRFEEIYKDFYKSQLVNIGQLVHSPWGYGLSHPQNPEPGDMSYQLGLVQILVMLMLIFSLFFRRIRGIREIRVIGGFILGFFLLSVFLMLKISSHVWENLPFFSLVQFPLRFSAIAVFCAAIAAALLVKWIRLRWMTMRSLVFITLLVLVIYANRNHWNINEKFDPGEKYYLNLKTTSTTYGEHLPSWGRVMEREASGKLEVIGGIGEIRIIRDKSALVMAEISTTGSAKVRLNQIYFPGWEIKVDGEKKEFNYLEKGENYGLPVFSVGSGRHMVEAQFKNTIDRNLADSITIITVIIFICRQLIRK